VLGIVRSHRGAIRVRSSPGSGSTFEVLFPASSESAPVPERGSPFTFRGSGTVLLIDDEDIVRAATRRMLVHFGFVVLEARDGREGVEVFRAHANEIRCVILDMTMPVMDGVEAFDQLRAIRPDVNVLLSSGYDEQDATRRLVADGLAAFIKKPFSASELGEKLAAMLR
jgi:two-component system cell cycle sensor histidine kinase/response regulator CckA